MAQQNIPTSADAAVTEPSRNFSDAFKAIFHRRVITMLLLGFSAGVPILLIFSSLSLWLREAGVQKSAVTYFSWAALGYSFKFVWAPLVDKLPLPGLTHWLGRRRGWLLLSQFTIIAVIGWMALTDPSQGQNQLTIMALAAVALGFSSATQDIVIDAYRIESGTADLQAMMSSSYVAGYRVGMIIAGAGALYLAEYFGSTSEIYSYVAWKNAYGFMALAMLVGVLTTLVISEPVSYRQSATAHTTSDHLRFLLTFVISVIAFLLVFRFSSELVASTKASLTEAWGNRALASLVVATVRLAVALAVCFVVARTLIGLGVASKPMVDDAYKSPVTDFFNRYGMGVALLLLALVGFYRVSDIVLGVIANVFYQDVGFEKSQIAEVSKVFGVLVSIAGGYLGGILAVRFGVMRILLLGAILSALTNLLFIMLANSGPDMSLLYVVIGADNLAAGLASAAFIAFLSSLTNISFTAMQYAIFSSLMTLFPKVLGGYSGSIVEEMGYPWFFSMTALLTVPVILLILFAGKRFDKPVVMASP